MWDILAMGSGAKVSLMWTQCAMLTVFIRWSCKDILKSRLANQESKYIYVDWSNRKGQGVQEICLCFYDQRIGPLSTLEKALRALKTQFKLN